MAVSQSAANAVAAVPNISCTSSPSLFNTGINGAGTGVLATNAFDTNWEGTGHFNQTSPTSLVSLPPAGTTWSSAYVGNRAPGAWAASPFGNAQWISMETGTSATGDWYYRYRFTLDPSVDVSSFTLSLNFLSDNDVMEVWDNGVPQSGKTVGLPQQVNDPYNFNGYTLANAAGTVLDHDWQAGANTITVQIKSGANFEGFDVQARPSVLCPAPDISQSLSASAGPVTTIGQTLTYSSILTNTGNVPMTAVSVTSSGFTGHGAAPVYTCPSSTLAVGASQTCTATYSVVAADLGQATINETSTGHGTGQGLNSPTNTTPAPTSIPVDVPVISIAGGPSTLTNNPVRPIAGTTDAAVGSTVTVHIAGQTLTATVQTGGTWTVTPITIADGTYPVSATVLDAQGGTATSTETLTVDTTAPAIAFEGAATKTTNNPTPAITGTTDQPAGSTVTVTVAGQTLTTTVQTGGTWTVTPTTIADGTYPVTASTTDAAGNTATAIETLIIDTTPPVIAINGPAHLNTNNPTRPITGTTDQPVGSTVTVTVAGQTLTTTVQTGGTWTVTPTALADGDYPVTASTTDEAGNSATADQTLTVDTVAPIIAIDGAATKTTNNPTPAITGTTDQPAGSTVTVTVAGQTLTTTVQTGGTWTVTPTTIADGTYPVTASTTDTAGNTATAIETLIIDTTPPVIAINGPAHLNTNNPTRPITGTTDQPVGSTVTVTVAGQTLTTTVQTGGTWTVTPTALADGDYPVTASTTDEAGNSATADQTLTVDTVAPTISISGPTTVTSSSSTPTISGTTDAAVGSTVTVTVAGQTLTTTVQTGGTWTVTPTIPIARGTHPVTASVTDAAGNTATDTHTLLVSASAPLLTVAGGSSAVTQSIHPVIHGTTTAPPGSAVVVTVDGVTYRTIVKADSTWSITTTTALASGTYEVKVAITAPNGDVTTGTQALTVTSATAVPLASSQPAPPVLAATGSNVQRPAGLGGLLVLGGLGLMALARRRRLTH